MEMMGRARTPHSYMASTKSRMRMPARPRMRRQMERVTSPRNSRKSAQRGGRPMTASPTRAKSPCRRSLRAAPAWAGMAKARCSSRASPAGRSWLISIRAARAALCSWTRKTSRLLSQAPRAAARCSCRMPGARSCCRASAHCGGQGVLMAQLPETVTCRRSPALSRFTCGLVSISIVYAQDKSFARREAAPPQAFSPFC